MGEESPWEGRLSPVRFRGLMWSPGEVEADAGSKSRFLPGARTRAWRVLCCLLRPLVAVEGNCSLSGGGGPALLPSPCGIWSVL